MLYLLQIVLLDRQGIAQDRRWIGDGVARWQGCQHARRCSQQANGKDGAQQQAAQPLTALPQALQPLQGPNVAGLTGAGAGRIHAAAVSLPGLWHSRTIRPDPFCRNDLKQRFSYRHND